MSPRGAWFAVALLAVGLSLAGCGSSSNVSDPDSQRSASDDSSAVSFEVAARRRAVAWLADQQADDGGWHSQTYGQMRCGVGDTALLVYALAQLPAEERRAARPQIDQGLRFLLANLAPQGFVRAPDAETDYPTYATALALLTLKQLDAHEFTVEQIKMIGYLQASQQSARHGSDQGDPDYGGWNLTGEGEVDARITGETNISVTSLALAALRAHDALDASATAAGLAYLGRCQNASPGDGGFFFTPEVSDPRNKAGVVDATAEPPAARSYGTTTADGVLGLLACGLATDDDRVRAALGWLHAHDEVAQVPGIPDTESTVQAREGLRFYYWAAIARVAERFPDAEFSARRQAVVTNLAKLQSADGSWRNPNPLMREDDPLVATALALIALSGAPVAPSVPAAN